MVRLRPQTRKAKPEKKGSTFQQIKPPTDDPPSPMTTLHPFYSSSTDHHHHQLSSSNSSHMQSLKLPPPWGWVRFLNSFDLQFTFWIWVSMGLISGIIVGMGLGIGLMFGFAYLQGIRSKRRSDLVKLHISDRIYLIVRKDSNWKCLLIVVIHFACMYLLQCLYGVLDGYSFLSREFPSKN